MHLVHYVFSYYYYELEITISSNRINHDVQPIVDKYCISTESRQINVIDPFKFVMEGQEEGLYIAVIEEVKHGVFLLKAVYRQPIDQTNSASYDILRPGR